jgi:triphosphoribosyl-dephospho-CoA synthase
MRQITRDIASSRQPDSASYIAWAAQEALNEEVGLWPKPGLVTPNDTGSHSDMDLTLFLRSVYVLRGYFHAVALAGACEAEFEDLRRLGLAAEARMLDATGKVNTHRGAIFSLGLLAAAAGWRIRRGLSLSGSSLGETVAERWGEDIILSGAQYLETHGAVATRRYAAMGARAEAAAGFPTLFCRALPCLTTTLRVTGSPRLSLVQSLFAIMAALDDTNLLHRGGRDGLDFVQKRARAFLLDGGVLCSGWQERVLELHDDCKARRLSPGGGADMLAAVWFVHLLQAPT